MKVEICKRVAYTDVNPAFRLKLGAFFRLLQEAAVEHSERVGLGSKDLVDGGTVWILNKMAASFYRHPGYRETIRILTWHRGSRGFRAYRDFLVFAGDECLAAVTSLWLFFDLEKKRLKKVPTDLADAYSIESEWATEVDLDEWKPDKSIQVERRIEITTRYSDFDPLGHMNNTAYFDLLATLAAAVDSTTPPLRGLKIHFQKEIDRRVPMVAAAWQAAGSGGKFQISSPAAVHASGELSWQPPGAGGE